MKQRSFSIMVVALALLIAVGGMGVVYGAWSTVLKVDGTVATTSLSVQWDDTVNPPSFSAAYGASCGTVVTSDTITVTITNAYPGFVCNVPARIWNTSPGIPVKLVGISTAGTSSALTPASTGFVDGATILAGAKDNGVFTITVNDNAAQNSSYPAYFRVTLEQATP